MSDREWKEDSDTENNRGDSEQAEDEDGDERVCGGGRVPLIPMLKGSRCPTKTASVD